MKKKSVGKNNFVLLINGKVSQSPRWKVYLFIYFFLRNEQKFETVGTRFGLDPKREWIKAHVAQQ